MSRTGSLPLRAHPLQGTDNVSANLRDGDTVEDGSDAAALHKAPPRRLHGQGQGCLQAIGLVVHKQEQLPARFVPRVVHKRHGDWAKALQEEGQGAGTTR